MQVKDALIHFEAWYSSLQYVKANDGPAAGTIAASLVVLEQLQKDYDLSIEARVSAGGSQVKGASGRATAAVLRKFNEIRPFSKEGGRTNRLAVKELKLLLNTLASLKLEQLTEQDRNQVLISFQEYLVARVRDYHNRQKLEFIFDPKNSTWQTIHQLIKDAQAENKGGPVVQHLVGAKLELRFPSLIISNEPTSAADAPTNRQGDFRINDTIFHITVAPMPPVFEKCNQNLVQGLKAYLLVPDSKLAASREMAEQYCQSLIAVESLESFISQNVEEISGFSNNILKSNVLRLIEIYNRRVDEVEIDKSLMIELPSNLRAND